MVLPATRDNFCEHRAWACAELPYLEQRESVKQCTAVGRSALKVAENDTSLCEGPKENERAQCEKAKEQQKRRVERKEKKKREKSGARNLRHFVVYFKAHRSDGAERREIARAGHDATDGERDGAEAHFEGHAIRRPRTQTRGRCVSR